MPGPDNKSLAIRFISIASVVYGVADALPAIVFPLFALVGGNHRAALDELARAPMVILLLTGGIGLLRDKPWSRYLYWVLPAYSITVTLLLLPGMLRAVPRGGDFATLLTAIPLYWPIATALLYVFAFIVSDHFFKLEQSRLPPRPDPPPGWRRGTGLRR